MVWIPGTVSRVSKPLHGYCEGVSVQFDDGRPEASWGSQPVGKWHIGDRVEVLYINGRTSALQPDIRRIK